MARPAAVSKCLYYPTPLSVIPGIVKHIKVDLPVYREDGERGIIFDPCCGEGKAVAMLQEEMATLYPSIDWVAQGIELDGARADKARELLGDENVIHAAIEQVDLKGTEKADIVFNNPPYDIVAGERVEFRFIVRGAEFLRDNGLYVLVVSESLFSEKYKAGLVRALKNAKLRWLKVFRFPEDEYERFKQVVIIGNKGSYVSSVYLPEIGELGVVRPPRYSGYSSDDQVDLNMRNAHHKDSLDLKVVLDTLPVEPLSKLETTWHELEYYIGEPGNAAMGEGFRPLAPMKDTHAAMIAAAGMLNGVKIGNSVVRGSTSKREVAVESQDTAEDGRKIKVVTTIEVLLIELAMLDLENGTIKTVNNIDHALEFERVMLDHAPEFVRAAHELYPPLCDEFTVEKWREAISMVKAPRAIKGKENGLFPAQIERVAWLLEGFRHYKALALIGEMSVGKTLMSLATAALQVSGRRPENQHIVIMLPPKESLVRKWARESKKALRLFNDGKGPTVHIVRTISDAHKAFQCTGLNILLIKETTAKASSGWSNIMPTIKRKVDFEYIFQRETTEGLKGYARWGEDVAEYIYRVSQWKGWEYIDHGDGTHTLFKRHEKRHYRCPDCGNRLEMLGTSSKYQCSLCSPDKSQEMKPGTHSGDGQLWSYHRRKPKKSTRHFAPNFNTGMARLDHVAALVKDGKTPDNPVMPSGAYPIAKYIRKHYANRYFLIVDEAHRSKSGDSNVGYAFMDLVSGSWRTLQMTGTLFGGLASSIFYLLYRTVSSFRNFYTSRDEQKFINAYGLYEQVTKYYPKKSYTSGSGYDRYDGKPNQRPGVAPGMAALVLPQSVFLTLDELGIEMVDYAEHTLWVDVTAKMRKVVGKFLDAAVREAIRMMKDSKDASGMGQYRMARRATWDIPGDKDSAAGIWRDPVELEEGATLFPKEEALLRIIWDDKLRGRKTIVYTMQIEARDPTGRLCRLMSERGMKGVVMRQSVKDRVEWITEQIAQGADAIFCSPELVAEGVDLDMVHTEVWLGSHDNLYVVSQANRRAWRITQELDVRVIYLGYNETPQSDSLNRTARKMAAAQAIQGDIRKGLAYLQADDDFVTELQDRVSYTERLDSDLTVDDFPILPKDAEEAARIMAANGGNDGPAEPVKPKVVWTPPPSLKLDRKLIRSTQVQIKTRVPLKIDGEKVKSVEQGKFL